MLRLKHVTGGPCAVLVATLLCLLCSPLPASAGETLDGVRLAAYSLEDQTAGFVLPDGTLVLAEAGVPFHAAMTLERVLVDRIVVSAPDPEARDQRIRYWIDIRDGVDAARVRKLAALPPDKAPDLRFDPPVIVPLGDTPLFTGPADTAAGQTPPHKQNEEH